MNKAFYVHDESFGDRSKCFSLWPSVRRDDGWNANTEKLRLVPTNPSNKFLYPYMNWLYPIFGDTPAIVVVTVGGLAVEGYTKIGEADPVFKKGKIVGWNNFRECAL